MKNILIDTNVLLSDPTSIYKFDENAIFIPTTVLYELDNIKDRRDKAAVSREAREAIRIIEDIIDKKNPDEIRKGVPIKYPANHKNMGGTLAIIPDEQQHHLTLVKEAGMNDSPDARIIAAALHLQDVTKQPVTLVTQDINMRLIAASVGVEKVEGYRNEKALEDVELLSKGITVLDTTWGGDVINTDFDETFGTVYLIPIDAIEEPYVGLYVTLNDEDNTILGDVVKITNDTIIIRMKDSKEMSGKDMWGIKPKNAEQSIAADFLLDPEVDLAIIYGPAGTGKTILAMSAAIQGTLADKQYDKIILTRALSDLDQSIGYTPGTEEEKMKVWLGGFEDALEVIHKNDAKDANSKMTSSQYVAEKANIQFKSINFMRGRSLTGIVIIDEAQNLTLHQVKSIVTRASANCKLIFLGNLSQIDSHWISPRSSGLTHLVVESKDYEGARAIYLSSNERSKLAAFGEQKL